MRSVGASHMFEDTRQVIVVLSAIQVKLIKTQPRVIVAPKSLYTKIHVVYVQDEGRLRVIPGKLL